MIHFIFDDAEVAINNDLFRIYRVGGGGGVAVYMSNPDAQLQF